MDAFRLDWGRLKPGLWALPTVHGRLPFAEMARRALLARRHDALALELPPEIGPAFLAAVEELPELQIVAFRQDGRRWYLPIDPCDAIVHAARIALQERIPIRFVDSAHPPALPPSDLLPDPAMAEGLGLGEYADICRPILSERSLPASELAREDAMAIGLADCPGDVLFVFGMGHMPGVEARLAGHPPSGDAPPPPPIEDVHVLPLDPRHAYFALQDWPFAASEAERFRADPFQPRPPGLVSMATRLWIRARQEIALRDPARRIPAQRLRTGLRFAFRMARQRHALLPDLWEMVAAAKGTCGDAYASALFRAAVRYSPSLSGAAPSSTATGSSESLRSSPDSSRPTDNPSDAAPDDDSLEELPDSTAPDARDLHEVDEEMDEDDDSRGDGTPVPTEEGPLSPGLVRMGRDRIRLPGRRSEPALNRTSPHPRVWRTIRLARPAEPAEVARWISDWHPESLCSHLPEDIRIERFNAEAREKARSRIPSTQPRSQPFTSSLLDGLDLRETLRHIHEKRIWVKEYPSRRVGIEAVVIIFDQHHDEAYPHRGTWYAEHAGESNLLFYATDPFADLIGPGIGRCRYGGLALLYPPRPIADVFSLELPFETRLAADRLIAGACIFSRESTVAVVSEDPPSLRQRLLARQTGRRLLHVPMRGFSAGTIEKIRTFHVLDGKHVRNWADRFIRGD